MTFNNYRTFARVLPAMLLIAACATVKDLAKKMGETPAIQPPAAAPAMKPGVRLALSQIQGKIRFPHGVTSVRGVSGNKDDLFQVREAVERALLLLPEERKIVIVGHSDPIGGPHSALYFGAARARSVRNYLVSKGISRKRLVTMSAGASELQNKKNMRALENHRITFTVQ